MIALIAAAKPPGTSDPKVIGSLLDLWTAGIDHFVASLDDWNRQVPFSIFNYPEININRLTRGLQFFSLFFPYILSK
jgi:hypothetical protein